jgi:hypothetical protein
MLLINTMPPTDPWSYKQQKPQLFECFAISLTNQWYVPAFAYSRWLTKCGDVEFWLEQIGTNKVGSSLLARRTQHLNPIKSETA